MVSFGLIGYGLFGTHHANAIANSDRAKLTAIAVKSKESRRAAKEAHPSAEVHGDYKELLGRDDIDVVSIVVPNQLHYEVARAALEAGKHLFLEKPMAVELPHCDELLALAKTHDRFIAINHELRLSSLWGSVKQLIDDGQIGQPQYALIELSRFPYRHGSEGWRYDIDRVGNWILEEPIHFFDLARWYLSARGEPTSIYARANSRQADHPELRDNFSAIVNFPSNAYAVVSQTLSAFEHHVTAKVVGDAGTIWGTWSAADARSDRPTYHLRYGLADSITEVPITKPTGELLELSDQIAAVVNCVERGDRPPCDGEDGRWSTLLCLVAEQSVQTGELVSVQSYVESC